ncbi:MAG TPA: hypothetical protein VF042_07515 [Gemmatimonadaceae bacterium]
MPPRFQTSIGVLSIAAIAACSDADNLAQAVTLQLYSVDGIVIPAPLTSAGGKPATIGTGRLQGNNWGDACGFAVGLAEGPLTVAHVPSCRLMNGEERSFKITITDSRFPAGSHDYRFVPLE